MQSQKINDGLGKWSEKQILIPNIHHLPKKSVRRKANTPIEKVSKEINLQLREKNKWSINLWKSFYVISNQGKSKLNTNEIPFLLWGI